MYSPLDGEEPDANAILTSAVADAERLRTETLTTESVFDLCRRRAQAVGDDRARQALPVRAHSRRAAAAETAADGPAGAAAGGGGAGVCEGE